MGDPCQGGTFPSPRWTQGAAALNRSDLNSIVVYCDKYSYWCTILLMMTSPWVSYSNEIQVSHAKTAWHCLVLTPRPLGVNGQILPRAYHQQQTIKQRCPSGRRWPWNVCLQGSGTVRPLGFQYHGHCLDQQSEKELFPDLLTAPPARRRVRLEVVFQPAEIQ